MRVLAGVAKVAVCVGFVLCCVFSVGLWGEAQAGAAFPSSPTTASDGLCNVNYGAVPNASFYGNPGGITTPFDAGILELASCNFLNLATTPAVNLSVNEPVSGTSFPAAGAALDDYSNTQWTTSGEGSAVSGTAAIGETDYDMSAGGASDHYYDWQPAVGFEDDEAPLANYYDAGESSAPSTQELPTNLTHLYMYYDVVSESTATTSITGYGAYAATMQVEIYWPIDASSPIPANDEPCLFTSASGYCLSEAQPTSCASFNTGFTGAVMGVYQSSSDYVLDASQVGCATSGPTWPPYPTTQASPAPSATSSACAQPTTINWGDDSATATGTSAFAATIEWPSGQNPSEVVLDPDDGSTPTQTISGQSFSKDARGYVKPASPLVASVIPAAGWNALQTIGPQLWCYNGSNWVDWGSVSDSGAGSGSGGGSNGGGTFDLSTCLGSSGMDLYNPVTWVTGLAYDTVCLLQWLFVPSSASVASLENSFGFGSGYTVCSSGGSASMVQWFSCMTQSVVAAPSTVVNTMQTVADSGGCTFPSGISTSWTVGHTTITPCSLVADAQLPAGPAGNMEAIIEAILSAFLLLAVAYALFHLLRRVVQGNS